jgi:hypothetical protein
MGSIASVLAVVNEGSAVLEPMLVLPVLRDGGGVAEKAAAEAGGGEGQPRLTEHDAIEGVAHHVTIQSATALIQTWMMLSAIIRSHTASHAGVSGG